MDDSVFRPGQLADILRGTPLFKSVGSEALAYLVEHGSVERRDQGDIICRQGEPSDDAYVLLGGEANVVIETSVDRRHVAVLQPHHVIGEIGLACDIPRTATVQARDGCTLLRIARTAFREVIQRYPDMAFAIIANLGLRLQEVSRALAYFTSAADTLAQSDLEPLDPTGPLTADPIHFGQISAPLSGTYARLAAEIERKRQRQQEMTIAARIQRAMLPPSRDIPVPARVAAMLRPAQDVGGDFYDYFMLPSGRVAFLVADVSGKGVPAALMMAVARTTLRSIAPDHDDPGACADRVNAVLTENNPESMFLTTIYAVLDAATGRLDYINAGHAPILILKADGTVQSYEKNNAAIGLLPDVRYTTQTLDLAPGDTVFLHTDGVAEATNGAGEPFGEDRLMALLQSTELGHPARVVERVMAAVQDFSGPVPFDDVTCLSLTYRPEPIP